jgi:hypothetical protein
MLAMELIPRIRERLAQLEASRGDARTSGRRAALWRAQQYAARRGRTRDDLRRYCLQALGRPRLLDAADENDYLRGFREGFQMVLDEIRRVETRTDSRKACP